MSKSHNRRYFNNRHGAVLVALCLVALLMPSIFAQIPSSQNRVAPSIPSANRYQRDKVFLEFADQLEQREGEEFQVLIGNVQFRKGDMFMYCDSAHFTQQNNSLNAFGNVRMEQGDSLFVYADELDYDGQQELAILYADEGKKVQLINNDVKLETDVFNYDLAIDLGYYEVGGVLTDKQNKLTSLQGEYSPSTKDANFYLDVHLNSISENDSLDMYTDTLTYNTQTHIADLVCYTEIYNNRGTILAQSGSYNTDLNTADLYNRSLVITNEGNTLTGDTIYYDRNNGYGEVFGNMVLTDTTHKSSVHGDYGFYNQLTDSAFVTGHACAKEFSKGDTLHLHGKTIRTYIDRNDSTRIMVAHPRVRFYRSDLQGLCDSLSFTERDTILYMHHHPIVWSGQRQIFGNTIHIHLNDSTVDWAKLPDFAFVAEHIDEEFYSQLSGKKMLALFDDSHLSHLEVDGNVQVIFLPMENDSTYNKLAHVESSFLTADFKGNTVEYMRFQPETPAKMIPIYLSKKKDLYLPQFKWYENIRPTSPQDIFNIPPEMEQLFNAPEVSTRRRRTQ